MNHRENTLSLLRRQGYEFMPPEFSLCPKLVEDFHRCENTELDYHEYFGSPWKHAPGPKPIADHAAAWRAYYDEIPPNMFIDGMGVGHVSYPTSMHMNQMIHPLESADSLEEIAAYPLPEFSADEADRLRPYVEDIHRSGNASIASMHCTVWETSWYIRSMEQLMMDMAAEPELAALMLDRITDMSLSKALIYARAGVDLLFLGDDVGMQQTTMMSDAMYSEWLKPRLKKIISAAKAVKPDLIVLYHSCGYVEPFIPHLIDAGI